RRWPRPRTRRRAAPSQRVRDRLASRHRHARDDRPMEVTEHALLEIRDASSAGHARRMAVDLAEGLGFSAHEIGRLGIVVTEAATNLVKHAGGGGLLLRTLGSNGTPGIGPLALH